MRDIVPIVIAIVFIFIFSSFTDRYDRMIFIEQEYEYGLTKKELAEKCLKNSPFFAIYLLIAGGVWIDYQKDKQKSQIDNKNKERRSAIHSNLYTVGILIVLLGGFYFVPLYWRALFTFGVIPILYPFLWIFQWVLSVGICLIVLLGIPIGIVEWTANFLPTALAALIGIAFLAGEIYLIYNYNEVLLDDYFLFPKFDISVYELDK